LPDCGAYLGYDTIGRTKYHADRAILDLVESVTALGHANRILFGTDLGPKTMLRAYGGGPGMDILDHTFLPRLRTRLGHDLEHLTMIETPAALTPDPREG
jgi:phosphotriesterase-related protein